MKTNLKVLLITIVICILVVETLGSLFFIKKKTESYFYNSRFMLFDEGNVFLNIGDIFKYHPNKNIKSEVYYHMNSSFVKEYSYNLKTNNFGLVQNNNLIKPKKSILFLGASFAEGQGADAWVNYFGGNYNNYQIINGGILGTGPEQAYLLEKHISENFDIHKVVYLYVPQEFGREVWNFKNEVIRCLYDSKNCKGNELFFGFNYNGKEKVKDFLKRLQIKKKHKQNNLLEKISISINSSLKQSFIINSLTEVRYNFFHPDKKKIKNNLKFMNKLIDKYDDDLIIIKMSSKNEIIAGSNLMDKLIKKELVNINYKNEIYECEFNNDINLFYQFDGHPNEIGYKYLYNCVNEILNNLKL